MKWLLNYFNHSLINELLKTKIKAPSHNTKLAHVIIKKINHLYGHLLTKLTQKIFNFLNRAPTTSFWYTSV